MCRFRIRLRFLLRVYVRDGDDVLLHVRGGRVHRHARVRGDCGHDVRVHHHVRDGLLLLLQVHQAKMFLVVLLARKVNLLQVLQEQKKRSLINS